MQIDYIRMRSFEDLLEKEHTLIYFLNRIKEKNAETITLEKVMRVIRRKISHPEFNLTFQIIDKEIKGMSCSTIIYDLYEERKGMLWLLSSEAKNGMRSHLNHLTNWFKEQDVKEVIGFNSRYTSGKTRWLTRTGMVKVGELYRKVI